MSEERMTYQVDRAAPQSLDALASRPCALPYHDPSYQPPTRDELNALIKLAGWSQVDTARIVGINYTVGKGSPTIRRWRAPEGAKEHRTIPYSAWRLLLAAAGAIKIDPGDYTHLVLSKVDSEPTNVDDTSRSVVCPQCGSVLAFAADATEGPPCGTCGHAMTREELEQATAVSIGHRGTG